jgi:hypothetical protein
MNRAIAGARSPALDVVEHVPHDGPSSTELGKVILMR